MRLTSFIPLLIKVALAVALTIFSTAVLFGQEAAGKTAKAGYKTKYKEFCQNNSSWNGDRVGFNELRQMTIPATGSVTINGGKNGGIRVRGENRSDIKGRFRRPLI